MLLAALALLPLAGLVAFNAITQRRQAAVQAENDALRLVLVCANNEERVVGSADELLTLTGELPPVKSFDARACSAVFDRILSTEPGYTNIGLLNTDGAVIASAKPVGSVGPLRGHHFFTEVLTHASFAVSDFEVEPGAAESDMFCGDPVRGADGRVVGVVFAELNLDWMAGLDTELGLASQVTITVVNPDGTILMRVPDSAHWVGRTALNGEAGRAILRRVGSSTADEVDSDNVRRLYAYTPLDPIHGLGAYVSAGIPDAIAFQAPRKSEHRQLWMLVAFAVGAFAVAWFVADLLVLRWVRMLLRATQKVTAGDLETRAGRLHGGSEFRELAQSFDTMAASLAKQKEERDAAEQLLERRVEERTAEFEEANRKLRAFITNVPAILFSIDRNGVITMAEGLGMEVLRFIEGGIVGHTVAELYGDMPGVVESVKRALAGESLVSSMQLQQMFFEVAYSPIRGPDGAVTGVIGVAHDVTERHKAEQALEVSERRMRLIVENAYDAYIAMDREGMITDWNPQAEQIFGWTRQEAIGRSLAETIIPKSLREAHLKGLVHYLHTGVGPVLNRRVELQALRRSGEQFPVELTITALHIEDQVIFSAFIHDISERVHAKEELELTANELRRSNQELEQFAYIASHDLQEPLRMVASYTQLLERRYSAQLDAGAREFIGYAVAGAKRMQQFITGLLRYSRVGTESHALETVNLQEILSVALANLRIAIDESGAKIEAESLPVIRGDSRQLLQLFQNLIGNALKFRRQGEAPHIEIRTELGEGFWRIAVRDNGIGLDPKFAERVFTIFQRLHTREEYEGTGLGLAICKKIVERHGGRIWVESREGEGATFFFTLPAAPEVSP